MILLTLDVGFASIVAFPPSSHPGIVVLRMPLMNVETVRAAVNQLLASADLQQLGGAITILEPGRIRVRR